MLPPPIRRILIPLSRFASKSPEISPCFKHKKKRKISTIRPNLPAFAARRGIGNSVPRNLMQEWERCGHSGYFQRDSQNDTRVFFADVLYCSVEEGQHETNSCVDGYLVCDSGERR